MKTREGMEPEGALEAGRKQKHLIAESDTDIEFMVCRYYCEAELKQGLVGQATKDKKDRLCTF